MSGRILSVPQDKLQEKPFGLKAFDSAQDDMVFISYSFSEGLIGFSALAFFKLSYPFSIEG